MTYGGFKDFPRGAASLKVLNDKAFDITKFPKFDGYQSGLASIIHEHFDEKSALLESSETLTTSA